MNLSPEEIKLYFCIVWGISEERYNSTYLYDPYKESLPSLIHEDSLEYPVVFSLPYEDIPLHIHDNRYGEYELCVLNWRLKVGK